VSDLAKYAKARRRLRRGSIELAQDPQLMQLNEAQLLSISLDSNAVPLLSHLAVSVHSPVTLPPRSHRIHSADSPVLKHAPTGQSKTSRDWVTVWGDLTSCYQPCADTSSLAEWLWCYFMALCDPNTSHSFARTINQFLLSIRTQLTVLRQSATARNRGDDHTASVPSQSVVRQLREVIAQIRSFIAHHAACVYEWCGLQTHLAQSPAVQTLESALARQLLADMSEVCMTAVEQCVLVPLYDDLLTAYHSVHSANDLAFARNLTQLSSLSATDLGLPPFFQLLPSSAPTYKASRVIQNTPNRGHKSAGKAPSTPAAAPDDTSAARGVVAVERHGSPATSVTGTGSAHAPDPYARVIEVLQRVYGSDTWRRKVELLVYACRLITDIVCEHYDGVVEKHEVISFVCLSLCQL